MRHELAQAGHADLASEPLQEMDGGNPFCAKHAVRAPQGFGQHSVEFGNLQQTRPFAALQQG